MEKYKFQELIEPWLIQIESIDLEILKNSSRKELFEIRNYCIEQINKILNPTY